MVVCFAMLSLLVPVFNGCIFFAVFLVCVGDTVFFDTACGNCAILWLARTAVRGLCAGGCARAVVRRRLRVRFCGRPLFVAFAFVGICFCDPGVARVCVVSESLFCLFADR